MTNHLCIPRAILQMEHPEWTCHVCSLISEQTLGSNTLAAAQAPRRHFVDDRPKPAHLPHGFDERVKLRGLDHVGVDAELVAVEKILLFARGAGVILFTTSAAG